MLYLILCVLLPPCTSFWILLRNCALVPYWRTSSSLNQWDQPFYRSFSFSLGGQGGQKMENLRWPGSPSAFKATSSAKKSSSLQTPMAGRCRSWGDFVKSYEMAEQLATCRTGSARDQQCNVGGLATVGTTTSWNPLHDLATSRKFGTIKYTVQKQNGWETAGKCRKTDGLTNENKATNATARPWQRSPVVGQVGWRTWRSRHSSSARPMGRNDLLHAHFWTSGYFGCILYV